MSHTMVPLNIVSALVKAEDVLGKDRVWGAINEQQQSFLLDYFARRAILKGMSPAELRSWVDTNAENLNKILADEGFSIKLDDFGPNGFGVVSILDLLVEWIVAGKKSPVYTEHGNYAGVRFTESYGNIEGKGVRIFETFTSDKAPEGIALLHTKSGDRVYMTVAQNEASGFDLIKAIEEIRKSKLAPARYSGLSFPMIDYDQQTDLSWLVSMNTVDQNGNGYEVAQALQQTKFKMNEVGAHLKDAVAIAIRTTSIRQEVSLDINKPFYLWIERDYMDVPILYGYFDEKDWKDPKNLNL